MKPKYTRPLTLEELANRPDSEIDFSDIPELDENFWANAVVMSPKTKPQVAVRVDQDILDFFKGEDPKGYTSRMAAVLRAYVDAQTRNH